jgi:phosphatidylserine/phosphatidylglycerophosphate/cardiolipin synthase-like enzyme
MPTFDELLSRYMYTGSSPAVRTYPGCRIEPLLFNSSGGKAYFDELRSEINRSGVSFIYIAGWWLDSDFSLDGTSGTKLVDLLKAKSAAGVDVRVLGWVMPPEVLRNPQVQSRVTDIVMLNGDTMRFIEALRGEATLRDKACLNIISHPAGAVHTKMAIVGGGSDAVGFTGGIDFVSNRHDRLWHDVTAKVTGPAVQGLYDFYREMWGEVKGRTPAVGLTALDHANSQVTIDSHSTGMPALAQRTIRSTGSHMVVQSVSTIPRIRIASPGIMGTIIGGVTGITLPTNQPISYAPNGRFQVKAVWEKAIKAAQSYVYIEDQALTSAEVFSWVNDAVKRNFDLKVILLIGGNDPATPSPPIMLRIMNAAINGGLLNGLTQAQVDNIGFFMYRDQGSNTKFVHTKSTIVDDQWAIIGSANCMRRSLYTDLEHSVAFMDRDGTAVPAYRAELWGEHLAATIPDMTAAVAQWFTIPFRVSGTPGTQNIERIPLWPIGSVLTPTTLTTDDQALADELHDVDSRNEWGARLMEIVRRQVGTSVLSP